MPTLQGGGACKIFGKYLSALSKIQTYLEQALANLLKGVRIKLYAHKAAGTIIL